jgi:hypothetical protein
MLRLVIWIARKAGLVGLHIVIVWYHHDQLRVRHLVFPPDNWDQPLLEDLVSDFNFCPGAEANMNRTFQTVMV